MVVGRAHGLRMVKQRGRETERKKEGGNTVAIFTDFNITF